mmetsp:Transcript_82774/g.165532  ORF Transcript_82774/g.165532 Transcript_82774/m.165532 type:complete len:209 (+) Transcript_82774:731-1357(+)
MRSSSSLSSFCCVATASARVMSSRTRSRSTAVIRPPFRDRSPLNSASSAAVNPVSPQSPNTPDGSGAHSGLPAPAVVASEDDGGTDADGDGGEDCSGGDCCGGGARAPVEADSNALSCARSRLTSASAASARRVVAANESESSSHRSCSVSCKGILLRHRSFSSDDALANSTTASFTFFISSRILLDSASDRLMFGARKAASSACFGS